MSLPEYKEAARELEAARQEIEAARAEVSELQAEKETLQGTVKELKAAKKVSMDLDRIKPEETMMGNIKGVTLKEVKQLKALAVRGAEAEQTVQQQANTIELQKAQITSLKQQISVLTSELSEFKSVRGKIRTAELEQENDRLRSKIRSYETAIERNNLWHIFNPHRSKSRNRDDAR